MTNILQTLTDVILLILIWMLFRRNHDLKERMERLNGKFKALLTTVEKSDAKLADRITELEKGLNPNYEAAKKANDALNDFNKGVAAILGYDPYAAMHKNDPKDE